jgi:hypothetical protein
LFFDYNTSDRFGPIKACPLTNEIITFAAFSKTFIADIAVLNGPEHGAKIKRVE